MVHPGNELFTVIHSKDPLANKEEKYFCAPTPLLVLQYSTCGEKQKQLLPLQSNLFVKIREISVCVGASNRQPVTGLAK